jgi:aryl-alcohol dehydrogenase-like predicted oxidoreductase
VRSKIYNVDGSVIPWSPIARGTLAKPRSATSLRSETDGFSKLLSSGNDAEKEIIDRVEALAKKRGVSMAKIATAWILSKDGISFTKFSNFSRFCSDCRIEFRREN